MKRTVLVVVLLALCFAGPAAAETTIISTAVPAASSAYSVGGLARVYVQVEAVAGTATATVTVEQRMGPSASWQTIKSITNPVAGAVAYFIEPVGEVRVNVSAVTVGTVRAVLVGYTTYGMAKW